MPEDRNKTGAKDAGREAAADAPPEGASRKGEVFYDASFSIEAIQHEPYENGFTWRTVIGAFFVAFVMLPGVIFMGLLIGQDLGTAADWVTIILFVELARRSFMTLKRQELFILKYTVSQLSHIWGGVALGGGIFASLVWQRYLRNSDAFYNFGIQEQVPRWFAPAGDAAYRSFTSAVWLPVIGVIVGAMVLSKLTQLSLGFLVYKITSDVEQLPFPLAPIHAEGAIALAERSQEKHRKGYRQYCFAVGVMVGAVFGIFYVMIPILSTAFLGRAITLIPIPFLDLTQAFETFMGGGTIGISLNLGLLFIGFVLPWRIVVGMFVTTILFQFVVNPVLCASGFMPSWQPGKDAIETHVAATIDIYLSVGIGTALAIFVVGVWGMVRSLLRYRRQSAEGGGEGGIDLRNFLRRDVARGDPPTWVAVAVWLGSACGFVVLANCLVNHGAEGSERFPLFWLVFFAFVFTPMNSYINARMIGIAGQHAAVPFIREGAIFASGCTSVKIWFAPLPLHNYGRMADLFRQTQLTRTRFTSILKAELLVFPLMMVASFIFWSYITSLGPIPSEKYPYVQKFWPQFATMKALWAASMQEGQSLLLRSLKPTLIVVALAGTVGLFGVAGAAGISTQYLYGGLASMNHYPHMAVMIFTGACLGRFVFARRFGRERWTNFAPILAVGFGAGIGLTGMFSIAIHFLRVSVGTGY